MAQTLVAEKELTTSTPAPAVVSRPVVTPEEARELSFVMRRKCQNWRS